MIDGLAMGGTRKGEYCRTIEMLVEMLNTSEENVKHALYFLHDSQYDNKDLLEMAELIPTNKLKKENQ